MDDTDDLRLTTTDDERDALSYGGYDRVSAEGRLMGRDVRGTTDTTTVTRLYD